MRSRFLVFLALTTIALAGCGDAPKANEAPVAPVGVASAGSLDEGGAVEGVVVDDSQAPLSGALVGLLEVNVQVTTTAEGAFRFDGVPPGSYQLSASRLGYDSVGKRVDVVMGSVTNHVLTLTAIAIESTYHDTFGPYSGFFACGMGVYGVGTLSCGVGPVGEGDQNTFEFSLTGENYRTILGELRWTPAAAGTTPALASYITYDGGSASHWWCASDGPSPNSWRYDVDEDLDPDETLSVCSDNGRREPAPHDEEAIEGLYMATDAGFPGTDPESGILLRLTYQQKFDAMLTVFYGEPAPDGFTGFPDA